MFCKVVRRGIVCLWIPRQWSARARPRRLRGDHETSDGVAFDSRAWLVTHETGRLTRTRLRSHIADGSFGSTSEPSVRSSGGAAVLSG
jgi:hypothetical protein